MGEPRKRKREVITVEIDSDGGDDIEGVDYDESDDEEDDIKTVDSDTSDDDDIELDIGGGLESRSAKELKNTPQPKTLNIKIQTTPLISKEFDPIDNQQIKTNRAAKNKLCTCSNCQKNNW